MERISTNADHQITYSASTLTGGMQFDGSSRLIATGLLILVTVVAILLMMYCFFRGRNSREELGHTHDDIEKGNPPPLPSPNSPRTFYRNKVLNTIRLQPPPPTRPKKTAKQ